jgi:hypothetical protein
MIRSLVSVAETLRCGLQHRDPETDEILVDVKNTELYLKVRHVQTNHQTPIEKHRALFEGETRTNQSPNPNLSS